MVKKHIKWLDFKQKELKCLWTLPICSLCSLMGLKMAFLWHMRCERSATATELNQITYFITVCAYSNHCFSNRGACFPVGAQWYHTTSYWCCPKQISLFFNPTCSRSKTLGKFFKFLTEVVNKKNCTKKTLLFLFLFNIGSYCYFFNKLC